MDSTALGPDLVIAGAARTGTSALAARLGTHPQIDPGAVKEPNYFSRSRGRGPEWYDSLYAHRRDGCLRLDASTSYTSPNHPEALRLLATEAPHATVLYVARDPIQRAVSHYFLRHYYFGHDSSVDFGTALRTSSFYVEGSDYERWLADLTRCFPIEQMLLVPFELATSSPEEVTNVVYQRLGLAVAASGEETAAIHRNAVVAYRGEAARRAARRLRRSALYPTLRHRLGADLMRKTRRLVTRDVRLPAHADALGSCDNEQLTELDRLQERAGRAVRTHLVEQDQRLGVDWARHSFASTASAT